MCYNMLFMREIPDAIIFLLCNYTCKNNDSITLEKEIYGTFNDNYKLKNQVLYV